METFGNREIHEDGEVIRLTDQEQLNEKLDAGETFIAEHPEAEPVVRSFDTKESLTDKIDALETELAGATTDEDKARIENEIQTLATQLQQAA